MGRRHVRGSRSAWAGLKEAGHDGFSLADGDAAQNARGPVSPRGALAAGLAGALGATAAATVGTAAPAEAASPPVLLSQDNTGPSAHRTAIFVPDTTEVASLGDSGSTFHNVFLGVYGVGATSDVRGDGTAARRGRGARERLW